MAVKPKGAPTLLSNSTDPSEFRERRRQSLLSARCFDLNESWLESTAGRQHALIAKRRTAGDLKPFGQHGVFLKSLQRLTLHYTAGSSIETVADLFDQAFAWFCKWHADFPPYLNQLEEEFPPDDELGDVDPDSSPVDFEDLEAFHNAISILSLAVLLGKGVEVAIVADLFRSHRGEDMLVEELLSPSVQPVTCKEFFHTKPYDPLVDAFFTARTSEQASAYVKKYLDGWYQAMESCSWHNSHTIAHEDMSPYNGYWSFESAAICLIHDIDDASFRDNLVYPKDLIDWARANDSLGKLKAAAAEARGSSEPRLRCQSGDTCPRDGWWFTPARAGSRQRFQAGQVMPDVGGPWGLTIWQRDPQQ